MRNGDSGEDRQREAKRAWASKNNREARGLGDLPWVENPGRRLAASADFRLYCDTYHHQTFHLGWSDDHLKVIGQIETAVMRGGLFATAMPRGSGKTTLAEVACEFAVVNGYHPFPCLIGASEAAAEEMLDSIKTELEVNDLLAADYPEVCVPIAKLEGIANRCKGQIYDGERTRIEWTAKAIVLPTLKPVGWLDRPDHRPFVRPDGHSLSSGAVIKVAGLTGRLRGMKHKRGDGATVRPTLVVPDDPQTDESAASPSQCETRKRILAGAVLGLGGPEVKISGIMPCTVIRTGDMADTILDRDKHPAWNGTRTKMVYAFPKNEKLWEEYKRIREDSLKAERGGVEATEFYGEHRAEMDEGAVVAWADRFNHDELSATQHAMNLLIDNPRAFHAEYQNEPLPEEESRGDDLTPDQVAAKVNRLSRGLAPIACNRVTAFIDIHGSVLYWVACGWEDDFTGYVLDYGTFPDQKRPYFTLRDAKQTLDGVVKNAGLEGQIYGGLEALTNDLLAREWPRDGGSVLKVERCLIDANWGTSTAVVKKFCRQSAHSAVLTPSHGMFVGASYTPMVQWPKKAGERVGHNWRMRSMEGGGLRSVVFDTNYWKTFVHTRLATAMGDKGCLSLFGEKPDHHRLFADHLCAEYRVRTEGRGRQLDEWKLRPERPDNHWLDCLVGCHVAASMQGVALAETTAVAATKAKRVSFAEMQKQRRA